MAEFLKYGEDIHLLNGYSNWSGKYLSVIGMDVPTEIKNDHLWTEIADFGKNAQTDYVWVLKPAAGSTKKDGDVVESSDHIYIQVKDDAGELRYLAGTPSSTYVTADKNIQNLDSIARWQVTASTQAGSKIDANGNIISLDLKGLDPAEKRIAYGDYLSFSVPNSSDSHSAFVLNVAMDPQPDPFKFITSFLLNSKPGATTRSLWQAVAIEVPPVNDGNGEFHLPANIEFGVTVLVNSAGQESVEVFIDDSKSPAASFSGTGTQDVNLGTKVINSGKGKVKVAIKCNGKPSAISSNNFSLLDKVYFGIVVSEGGTDGDYNDAIVILNWPIG